MGVGGKLVTEFLGRGVRRQAQEDPTWGFSRRDGAGRAVEGAAGWDLASLPGCWPRTQAVSAGVDVAYSSDAELVCAERPGDGGGPVRDRVAAHVRAPEPERADFRLSD